MKMKDIVNQKLANQNLDRQLQKLAADLTIDYLSDVFTELYPEVYNQLKKVAMQKVAASKEQVRKQVAERNFVDFDKIVNKNLPPEVRRKELLKALAVLGGTGALTAAGTYGLLDLLGIVGNNPALGGGGAAVDLSQIQP